jgi:hypothetical protein
MRVTTAATAALLLALLAPSAFAASADVIGTLSYKDGDVSVVRNGAPLPGVDIGADIENFDQVQTGADSSAEIQVKAGNVPQMTIKIAADTQMTIELSAMSRVKQQAVVGIIGGSIGLTVAKLLPSQDVQVKTDSAAMGVRGTSFDVTAPESGDVLVTCDEGDVQVTDDQGKNLHAIPGSIVEKRPGEVFQNTAVAAAGLADFRTSWAATRAQTIRTNALKLILANARAYDKLSRELGLARAELARNDVILSKWKTEDRAGKIGTRAEVQRERVVLGAILKRLRTAQFQIERVAWRLRRLKALHDNGVGVGALDGGVTTAQFFARLERERTGVEEALATTRLLSKLFVKRNNGALP